MAELTRLANGVTVAIDPMEGAQSASIGLYAAVGSRSEPDGKGGLVHGIIAPDRLSRMRLVSTEPGPGLVASAAPSPDSIPNNHLSYAVQWFLFAAAAGLIYALALRRREREEGVKNG